MNTSFGTSLAYANALLLPLILLAAQTALSVERVSSAVSPRTAADELPSANLKLDYSQVPQLAITLPQLDNVERSDSTRKDGNRRVRPFEIGFHRPLPDEYAGDLSDRLQWVRVENENTVVAALSVRSRGAEAMRAAIQVQNLGDGELMFYGDQSDFSAMSMTRADFHRGSKGTEVTWSPVVMGESIGIAVTLPSLEAVSSFSLVIEKISHIHTAPNSSLNRTKQVDCDNHVDVQCRQDEIHEGWEDAVAMIVFERGPYTFFCTGTLLNNSSDEAFIPYLITANHCISSHLTASTVSAYWFYQRAACGDGKPDDRIVQSPGGAEVLATSENQDTTLLKLRGRLPGGLTYAGWTSERLEHPGDVYGIHHPGGDVKKVSLGTSIGNEEVSGGLTTFEGIEVDWHEGVTEGGSSGSGLFRKDDGSYVGTLSGGEPGCYVAKDIYGSFADFFAQVKRWLAPDPTIDDDHGNTPESATLVANTSNTDGILELDSDLDYFRVELPTAGTLKVQSLGETDTVGTVFRADRRVRMDDDTSGSLGNFHIEDNVPAGIYFIEVRGHAEATGAYSLEVTFNGFDTEDEHGDTPDSATMVTRYSPIEGTLDWGNDLDYFFIELDSAGTLTVRSSGDIDTKGALLNQEGFVLAEDDDSGEGENFYIRVFVQAGTYYVEVSGFDRDTKGAYSLNISFVEPEEQGDDHGDSIADATDVSVPALAEGRLEQPGDTDFFEIVITEPSLLWIETSGGVNTNGSLLDATGTTVVEQVVPNAPLLLVHNIDAGKYFVAVRGAGDATTGDYKLMIKVDVSERSDTFRDGTLVDVPSSTSANLQPNETDLYQVELEAAGQLTITTTGLADPTGRLLDAFGMVLDADDDGGVGSNFNLERSLPAGIYYIEVRMQAGITTIYRLITSFQEFSPIATVVAVPSTTQGELTRDEQEYFRLEMTKSQVLRVETTGSTDTEGRLLDEVGSELAADSNTGSDSNFRIELGLPSGIYYVEVTGQGGQSGAYSLTTSLQPYSPSAIDVEVPSSTDAALDGGETDHYRLEIFEHTMLRVATRGSIDTVGTLVDQLGNTLASGDDSSGGDSNFEIVHSVAPGIYYVQVQEISRRAGSYTLEISSIDVLVNIPSRTKAKISDFYEIDFFRFDIEQPGMLIVDTTGETDTFGRLLDTTGNELAVNDDGGSGFNFRIVRQVDVGTYYVEVQEFFGDMGSYRLNVQLMLTDNPDGRKGEFGTDMRTKVLLRHLDGRWVNYSMNGRERLSVDALDIIRNRNWRLGTISDLNGDGVSDLLLNHTDGRWLVYLMDETTTAISIDGVAGMPRGSDWVVAASGSFLVDEDYLLFRNVDGRWRQAHIGNLKDITVTVPHLPADIAWSLAGIGDFGGNGRESLVFRHGSTHHWLMLQMSESDGDARWEELTLDLSHDPNLLVAAVADFDGDGKEGLLLRGREGHWQYRALDDNVVLEEQSGSVDLEGSQDWRVARIADLNDDGKDDVLLRNAEGRWRYYAMDGLEILTEQSGTLELPVSLSWSIPPVHVP